VAVLARKLVATIWLKLENNIEFHIFSYVQVQEIVYSDIEYIQGLFGSWLSEKAVETVSDLSLLDQIGKYAEFDLVLGLELGCLKHVGFRHV
jgi:hypothetical protein